MPARLLVADFSAVAVAAYYRFCLSCIECRRRREEAGGERVVLVALTVRLLGFGGAGDDNNDIHAILIRASERASGRLGRSPSVRPRPSARPLHSGNGGEEEEDS